MAPVDEVYRDPDDRELRALLGSARSIAIVGLSPNPERSSHEVAEYLHAKGYRIIPVNPSVAEVLGERSYGSLLEIPSTVHVDVVDVFRRSEAAPEIARQAVRIGAGALWLQEGVWSEDAYRIASDAGLDVVMGLCMKHTKKRLEEDA